MIPMAMALLQGGLSLAGGGLQMAGIFGQTAAMRRQARTQVAQLQSNIDTSSRRTAFEQGKVIDAVDATVARQANFFASGNMDAASGSPAILAAQTEAMGMQDQMLLAARGAQERADMYGQISSIWNKADDANRAGAFNLASTALGTVGKLATIAGGQPGGWGSLLTGGASSGASPIGQPMDIRPKLPWDLY